jgi:hypothetical protein
MKSSWRIHHGTRYFYADYSNFGRDVDALREEVNSADSEIERIPGETALVLVDIRHTVTSSEVVSLFKASTARTKGHVSKTAIVGVTGVQRILAQAVATFARESLHLFNETGAAADWLVGADERGGVAVLPKA